MAKVIEKGNKQFIKSIDHMHVNNILLMGEIWILMEYKWTSSHDTMLTKGWNIWKNETKTSTKIKDKCSARCKYNKMTNGQLLYDEFALEHFLLKKNLKVDI